MASNKQSGRPAFLESNKLAIAILAALAIIAIAYFAIRPADVAPRAQLTPVSRTVPNASSVSSAVPSASDFFSSLAGNRIFFYCNLSERAECVKAFQDRDVHVAADGENILVEMGEISENFARICAGANPQDSLVNLVHIKRDGSNFSIDCVEGPAYSKMNVNASDSVLVLSGKFLKCTPEAAQQVDLVVSSPVDLRNKLPLGLRSAFPGIQGYLPSGNDEYYVGAVLCRTIPAPGAALNGWFRDGDKLGLFKTTDHSSENAYATISFLIVPRAKMSAVSFLRWPFWKMWVEEQAGKAP